MACEKFTTGSVLFCSPQELGKFSLGFGLSKPLGQCNRDRGSRQRRLRVDMGGGVEHGAHEGMVARKVSN